MRHRDAGAHAKTRVDGVERRRIAQRVAADVAAQHGIAPRKGALHRVEALPVRAPRAQHGRTGGQSLGVAQSVNGEKSLRIDLSEFAEEPREHAHRILGTVLPAVAHVRMRAIDDPARNAGTPGNAAQLIP